MACSFDVTRGIETMPLAEDLGVVDGTTVGSCHGVHAVFGGIVPDGLLDCSVRGPRAGSSERGQAMAKIAEIP